MKLRAIIPARIAQRWHTLALQQLVEHVVVQADELEQVRAENKRLSVQWMNAEASADQWREDALRLQEELAELTDRDCGLTPGGHLVLVERKEAPQP